uniref:Uncharacterized protein n=1 Tax=Glossina brevipalpis TaxID=37001 RepID=A0A1A9W907_9MUSC
MKRNLITVPESIPVTLSLGIRSLVLRFDRGVFTARLAAVVLSSVSCWDGERLGDFEMLPEKFAVAALYLLGQQDKTVLGIVFPLEIKYFDTIVNLDMTAADDVFTTVLVLWDIVSDPACCSVSQLLSALNCFKYSTRPLNLDVPLATILLSANFSSTLKPTRLTFDVLLIVLMSGSFTASLDFSSISECGVEVTGTKHWPDKSLVLVLVGFVLTLLANCSTLLRIKRILGLYFCMAVQGAASTFDGDFDVECLRGFLSSMSAPTIVDCLP